MTAMGQNFLRRASRGYWRGLSGSAAVEFALVLSLLTIPILNVVDVGMYVYAKMELDNAAQAAAQTAWAKCASVGAVPATVNNHCAGLPAAMTNAAQSTALGSAVTIASTTEQYCCPGSGDLACQGPVATTTPTKCTSGVLPPDYIFVTTSYSYQPLFSAVSVTSLLATPITRTASMRMN